MSDLNNNELIIAYNKANRFGDLVGMTFNILEAGKVNYDLEISSKHLATHYAAHGGLIAAFMDAILGVGALSLVCTENKVVSTVEMKISFLNPVIKGDHLKGTSTYLKKGKRIVFMEGKIHNQNNILIASASGTFNSYPKEKAGY